ncbi:translation elongation factor-like protein [Candidatus Woesearchaeota archaeon]|nr:translation elongation factor-like protein [Candidatus Woesearchaeota archaeon]
MEKTQIGKITHFFDKISVAVLELTDTIKLGDKISIEGHDNVVEMTVDSMQIEREPVEEAGDGQSIGLKTPEAVKPGDIVYKLV